MNLLIALVSQALRRSGKGAEPSLSSAKPFSVDAVTFGRDEHGGDVLVFGIGATALALKFDQDEWQNSGARCRR